MEAGASSCKTAVGMDSRFDWLRKNGCGEAAARLRRGCLSADAPKASTSSIFHEMIMRYFVKSSFARYNYEPGLPLQVNEGFIRRSTCDRDLTPASIHRPIGMKATTEICLTTSTASNSK